MGTLTPGTGVAGRKTPWGHGSRFPPKSSCTQESCLQSPVAHSYRTSPPCFSAPQGKGWPPERNSGFGESCSYPKTGKAKERCHCLVEAGPAQKPAAFTDAQRRCCALHSHSEPPWILLSQASQGTGRLGPPPHPPGCPPDCADGTWQTLSQGLLELKQACPAPDDFPDHKAGRRGPQLIVRSHQGGLLQELEAGFKRHLLQRGGV